MFHTLRVSAIVCGFVSSETIGFITKGIIIVKMEYARKNTVKVRFGDQARSPSDGEMVTFVARSLGIKPDQVSHLYHDPYEKCIVIKFASETLMKMCLEQHVGEKSFGYTSGQYTKVMITDGNEEIKYVRLFYLPPEVPDREVAEFFKKFGVVKKIVHEKRSLASGFNCLSGTRGIYIDVTREIPPQVYICNYRSRVYYSGMQEKCFICKATNHLKPDCPRRVSPGTSKNLCPRERVREQEESLKLNFTNLNNLTRETKGDKSDQITIPCGDDLEMKEVSSAVNMVAEADVDVGSIVDPTVGSNKGSDWVNVSKATKHGASVTSGSSYGVTHSAQPIEEATSSKKGEVTVSNEFSCLLDDVEGSEISDLDPKKRKLSSKLSQNLNG